MKNDSPISLKASSDPTRDELLSQNESLQREIAELKETIELQSSLYRIAELHSSIYNIADITDNAEDIYKFGSLLHGALRELIDIDAFGIALNNPDGSFSFPYYEDPRNAAADNNQPDDMIIMNKLLHCGNPLILGAEETERLHRKQTAAPERALPCSYIAAPFFSHGTRIGTIISAAYDDAHLFNVKHLQMFTFISRQIGAIFERKLLREFLVKSREQLEETVKQRTAEITKTNELLRREISVREESEKLQSALFIVTSYSMDALEPEELYQGLHAVTGNVIYAKNFSIAMYDEEHLALKYPYFSDETGITNPGDNRFFTALNRYVLGLQKPIYFNKDTFPPSFRNTLSDSSQLPESWLGVPLRIGGTPFGVVSVHSYTTRYTYGEKESGSLSYIAPQIASAIDRSLTQEKLNMYYLELESRVEKRTRDLREANLNLQNIINLTVEVLSSASEIRDPYTAGHQKRVTKIALEIAKIMNLPEQQLEHIRIAGTLHDFGKISIPSEILSKPGTLSALETAFIHTHSQTGYEILKIIPFNGPIADIVHQHHEHLDGSGYPQGLKDDQILLESRILTVADVVEAISAHRPYRPSLGMQRAIEEITENRGTFYDPEVVDACLKILSDPANSGL